jgi:hypothetical protein
MVNISKHLLSSLIIFSSFDFHKSQLMESLSCGARQAYFLRDYARLKIIGERLIDLSPRSEFIGRYYLALSVGCQSLQGARLIKPELEFLSESPSINIRPNAMTAIAGAEIVLGEATQSTGRLLIEASALSLKSGDLISFIQSQSQISLLCSLNGNHPESLEVLRGLQPIVDKLGGLYGALKTDFYNSVAYELNQLGERTAATRFISSVIQSPYLKAYPEWQETANEIFVKKPSRSTVAVKKSNILYFPIRNRAAKTGEVIYRYNSRDYKLRDLCANRINDLCDWLDVANNPQSQREGNLL